MQKWLGGGESDGYILYQVKDFNLIIEKFSIEIVLNLCNQNEKANMGLIQGFMAYSVTTH